MGTKYDEKTPPMISFDDLRMYDSKLKKWAIDKFDNGGESDLFLYQITADVTLSKDKMIFSNIQSEVTFDELKAVYQTKKCIGYLKLNVQTTSNTTAIVLTNISYDSKKNSIYSYPLIEGGKLSVEFTNSELRIEYHKSSDSKGILYYFSLSISPKSGSSTVTDYNMTYDDLTEYCNSESDIMNTTIICKLSGYLNGVEYIQGFTVDKDAINLQFPHYTITYSSKGDVSVTENS